MSSWRTGLKQRSSRIEKSKLSPVKSSKCHQRRALWKEGHLNNLYSLVLDKQRQKPSSIYNRKVWSQMVLDNKCSWKNLRRCSRHEKISQDFHKMHLPSLTQILTSKIVALKIFSQETSKYWSRTLKTCYKELLIQTWGSLTKETIRSWIHKICSNSSSHQETCQPPLHSPPNIASPN